MLITISKILEIKDEQGNYGPQKRIKIQDATAKIMSGWVQLGDFDPSVWRVGGQVNLELSQNGKYTNFKLVKKAEKSSSGGGNAEILLALRTIYKVLKSIDEKLGKSQVASYPEPEPSPPPPPDYPELMGEDDIPF